jgi:hypothetical protein
MTERPRRISEGEAAELWRRAAELQAQAELRAHALAPVDDEDDEGLSLEQVSAAAESAGIATDYVRVALAEGRLRDAGELRSARWSVRWARRLLDRVGAIEVSRVLPFPPERVFDAVRTVFPQAPFELVAEDSVGRDPLRDLVLVYRLGSTTSSEFHSSLNWADVRVVLATVRAEGDGARLTVRAPLFRRGINVAATGTLGALGAFGGAALGSTVTALVTLAPALLVLPMAAGAAAGGAAGLGFYRGFYRWTRGGGETALTQLVQAVAMQAQPALPSPFAATDTPSPVDST